MAYAGFNRADRLTDRAFPCAVTVAFISAWGSGCSSVPIHAAPHTETSQTQTFATASELEQRFVSPYTYEHFIRAELAVAVGDLRAAAQGYRRALAGADEDPLVIARLAVTLDALSQQDEARELLDRGDSLDPTSEAISMARGVIAERRGDRDAAIAAYERAESFAPLSPQPPLALARVLHDAPERALAVLRRFAARNDRWSRHRLHVELRIALELADLDDAVTKLHALCTVTTATADELEAVARLALEHGRPVLAHRVLLGPRDRVHDRDLWLRVLIAVHDFEQANLVLASATPEELGGLDRMAELHAAMGADDEAAELAEVSLERDPSSSALSVLLRARGLDALAHEVEASASLHHVHR